MTRIIKILIFYIVDRKSQSKKRRMNNTTNNNSTRSNSTSKAVVVTDSKLFAVQMYQTVCVYLVLAIHFAYYFLILVSPKLKTKGYLYVNHATITSFFYIGMQFAYLNLGNTPSFADQYLNFILCRASELIWPFASYIRTYSVLLIAVYRYIAVFKIHLFKKINASKMLLIGPIVIVWTLSIGFPFLLKYSLQTSSSSTFCLDGYSPIFANTVIYFVLTNLAGTVVPSVAIITIYIMIIRK
jgi:hypothetical protein